MNYPPLLLGLLGLLSSLCTGVFGGTVKELVQKLEGIEEPQVASPKDAYLQFSAAIRRLQRESQYLFSRDVTPRTPIKSNLWTAIHEFHHLLPTVMVYNKAGLCKKDTRRFLKAWADLQGPITHQLNGDHAHPLRIVALAIGAGRWSWFKLSRVACCAPHLLCSEKAGQFLGAMSLLLGRMIRI